MVPESLYMWAVGMHTDQAVVVVKLEQENKDLKENLIATILGNKKQVDELKEVVNSKTDEYERLYKKYHRLKLHYEAEDDEDEEEEPVDRRAKARTPKSSKSKGAEARAADLPKRWELEQPGRRSAEAAARRGDVPKEWQKKMLAGSKSRAK